MIYPQAVWRPGRNAGYAGGRNQMRTVVCHYTVGRNSLPIMDQGYFNFLVSRDGTVHQGAEADAVCWHAGSPWNSMGPGIEIEYLPDYDDELWTPEQYAATGRLVDWLIGLGINPAFYDGDRITEWDGFITHRSLIQSGDWHHDWWPELPRSTGFSTTKGGVAPVYVAWGQTVFGVPAAALISGARKILDLTGPAGAYGVPQPALDWKSGPGRDAVPLILLDPHSLGALIS